MEISRSDRILAGTALVLILVPIVAFWGRLPEPLATHWGPGGRPDGNMSKLTFLLFSVFLWGLLWGAYLLVRTKAPSTWKSPFTFGFAGALIFVQASIVESNLDVRSWASAESLNGPLVLVAFLSSWLVGGLITYAVERR